MKPVRVTHPVFGLFMSVMIGAGCLAAGNSGATTRPMEIVPGERVGLIRLGMTDAELEHAMGKAAIVPGRESENVRGYPDKGMTVLLSRQKPAAVNAILAGDPNGGPGQVATANFDGRTAEGLGMGSSSEQIKKQYGEPEKDERSDPQVDFRLLSYEKRGIQFGLTDGRVTWLAVRQPKAE